MANPQPDQFTKISNEIINVLCKKRISGREWQILWTIIRKTWGFKKKVDYISKSQFAEITGIPRQKCQELLNNLEAKNIINKGITQKGNSSTVTYGINKDYEQWKVLPKKVTVTQKGNGLLPKKVTKVLPKKVNTKEKKDNLKKGDEFKFKIAVPLPKNICLTERMKSYVKKQGCENSNHAEELFEGFCINQAKRGMKWHDWTLAFYDWVRRDKKTYNADKYKEREFVCK